MVVSNALHPIFPIKDGANRNHDFTHIKPNTLHTNIDNFAYQIDLYLYPQNLLPVSELSIELVADATDATDDDVS